MRNYFLYTFLLFIFFVSNVYNLSANGRDTVYVSSENKRLSEAIGPDYTIIKVDKAPSFDGGRAKMDKFIKKNIRYPKNINTDTLTSRSVYLKYIVTEQGIVKDVTVMKGLTPELDAEAVRVVSSFPKMKPGQKDGKAVTTVVPYTFRFKEIDLGPDYADAMPSFPGGEKAMMEFIRNNLKYPQEAQQNKIEGKVTVRFVVDKTGKIKDITVLHGINHYLNAEAVRVIMEMPDWKPGLEDGKPVSVYFTIPIIYRLKNPASPTSPSKGQKHPWR